MKSGIFNNFFWALWVITIPFSGVRAQADSAHFDRPSLCIMMLAHPEQAFGNEIEEVFRQMDMPERFNEHSLGVRVVKFPSDKSISSSDKIIRFAEHSQLAKKMVAKWFSRNKHDGTFSSSLIGRRGLYNASQIDIEIAKHTLRGEYLLADAGEKLIARTFLVFCEYTYNRSYTGKDNVERTNESSILDYNTYVNRKDNRLRDFEIYCTSYLYQLDWNDSVAAIFYHNYYTEIPDDTKKDMFNRDSTTFHLNFLGSCSNVWKENNISDQYTNQQLITKACVRLRDYNLITLQHTYPQFRIKATLVSTTPLKAYIGLKEDVSVNSKFEVLQPEQHKDGTYTYKRVGVIQPIEGQIWDNRYMAGGNKNSRLDATYFKQVSGGALYPGLLIREME